MELFIDGVAADTDSHTKVHVTVSVASVTSPEYGRAGYSKSISIPATAANRLLMKDCDQINGRNKFNDTMHDARIEVDGCIVMEGYVRLLSCEKSGDGGRYVFNIIGAGKKWVDHASRSTFSSLFPEYSTKISAAGIIASWTSDVPVRWLPVVRNRYEPENSSVSVSSPEKVLSASDYHPFIHCGKLLRRIFSDAGYTVVSDFMDSGYFDSFYMSGRYIQREAELLKKRMDFMASRFDSVSAKANSRGQVYADPSAGSSTIGNIVDTADPKEEKEGRTIEGVFTNGGCFMKSDGYVRFVPQYALSLGFEYKFKYVTDYRIKDRTQLTGFDRIYLGNAGMFQFRITNRFQDRRNEFKRGKEYRCIICNFIKGYTYRLVANKLFGLNYETRTIAQFTTSSALVSTSEDGSYSNLRILYAPEGSSVFTAFEREWALYDGYINETGQTEVDVTVRTEAEYVTPGSPKCFDMIYFAGAASGMTLKLLNAEIRPVFQPQPAEGTTVSFHDIGVHNTSCMSVVKSLGGMFGLCFYTDELEKKVYIEPRSMFYRDDVVVDWSDRIDESKPMLMSDIQSEVPGTVTWRYRNGDGATAEFNRDNDTEFGTLSVGTGNLWQEWNEKVYENRLFYTTVNSVDTLPSASSASVPNAGDRAAIDDIYVDDLNFPPKIIRYLGMKALPAGEVWGWPSYTAEYPFSAFHYPYPVTGVTKPDGASAVSGKVATDEDTKGYTLCYEDRDGAVGLHRWWDDTIDAYRSGVRLTAWLKIWSDEIETFLRPNYLKRDFRARFRLHIDGEWSDWRLEEICDYSPSAISTKCIFTKII